jgi:hypothetical protein
MGIGLGVGINRSNYAQGIFGAYATRVVADGGVVEAGQCVDAVTGLLLNASLLLIPSGYKGGKLYAEIPTNGNGDLTWTRTSTAIRTNSSGLLESMATGVPRLSYMYGSCPAVLLEPQRTNLCLWSEDLTNGWSTEGLTVTANQTTSPDGNTTADLLQETAVTDVHRVYRSGITTVASTNYAFSFYVKKDTRRYVRLVLNQTTNAAIWVAAQFDLDNQTYTSGVGSGGGTFVSASISPAANGFYRITLVATATTTTTFAFLALSDGTAISSADSRGCNTYVGNTSNRIWGWGAQLEAGAYPTTYISTTSATATRVADSFSRNNIYTNGLITASGGTWFVELRGNVAYTRDAFGAGLYISDTTNISSNNINIRNGGTSRLAINKVIAGVSTALYLTTTDTTKLAIKWNGTSADIFANGTKVISATAFTPTAMQFLSCDATDVPKFIQQMALYPSPLSDTDCTTLTTL